MTNTSGNIEQLKGKKLLGYQPLTKEQYKNGSWDNAIALYTGKANNPEVFVLRSENQDYSCFDHWVLEKAEFPIIRNDTYKTIGETILEVKDESDKVKKWSDEIDQYWLSIKTKTKTLRFGHHWNDCHYPNSIWEEV